MHRNNRIIRETIKLEKLVLKPEGVGGSLNCVIFQTLFSTLMTCLTCDDIPGQLVVADVANKFAQSHFVRGVKETNVRLLMSTMIQYMQVRLSTSGGIFSKFLVVTHFISAILVK